MRCKNEVLTELMDYCCRGNCYHCCGCSIYPDCLGVLENNLLCNVECNEVCWTMVYIAFGMIDRGEW